MLIGKTVGADLQRLQIFFEIHVFETITWSGAEAPLPHVYIKTAMRPSKAKVSKQNHRPAYEQLFAH